MPSHYWDAMHRRPQVFTMLVIVRLVGYNSFYDVFRYFSLNEVIALLEDDADFHSANIYIQPPLNSTSCNTDEDSGSEDSGGCLDNFTGNQLRSEATATIFSSDHQKTIIGEVATNIVQSDNEQEISYPADSVENDGNDTTSHADEAKSQPVNKRQRKGKRCVSKIVVTKTAKMGNNASTALDDGPASNISLSVEKAIAPVL